MGTSHQSPRGYDKDVEEKERKREKGGNDEATGDM
jgi:hypothetical protein